MLTTAHPVVTTRDLRAAGVSADDARTLRARGELQHLWRGIDLRAGFSPKARLLAIAEVAADGYLSGPSGARALGFDVPDAWPDEITTPRPLRSRARLRVVRRPVPPHQRTTALGLPVTSVARTVADLLCRSDLEDVVWVLDQALTRGLRVADAAACLEVGQRGSRGARRLLALGRPGSESPLETRVRVILADAGLPEPVVQHAVTTAEGRFVARVDLAWPERKIALEADGAVWHGDPAALYVDRRRQNGLAILGWLTLRVTWADALDPASLARTVGRALDRPLSR